MICDQAERLAAGGFFPSNGLFLEAEAFAVVRSSVLQAAGATDVLWVWREVASRLVMR